MKRQLLSVLVFGLIACSEPTVDVSSDEAMKQSVNEVRQSLPQERRQEFDQAVQELAFADVSLEDLMAQGQIENVDLLRPKMRDRLADKTGLEIIAEAEVLRREREQKQREQALQEIAELEAKRRVATEAREQLRRFEVTRSRFNKVPQRFGRPEPIIELSVVNGTEHAVSHAYFLGTLASPGRSVPWLKESFNYSISGGLEPGESASWKLAPNMFSEWGTVEAPPDAVFTVEVVKVDGADGETLYDAEGLSEFETERLAELQQKYGPI